MVEKQQMQWKKNQYNDEETNKMLEKQKHNGGKTNTVVEKSTDW